MVGAIAFDCNLANAGSHYALLHHLQALEELPAEYIIHPRIVVSRKTGEEILRKAENPNPTSALRKLMRDRDGD